MGELRDGDSSDGLHGLDWHGETKEEASGNVVDGSEDESGGKV